MKLNDEDKTHDCDSEIMCYLCGDEVFDEDAVWYIFSQEPGEAQVHGWCKEEVDGPDDQSDYLFEVARDLGEL